MFCRPAPCGGNQLLVASCDCSLYCLDRNDGRLLWKYPEAKGAYHSSPAVSGTRVVLGNDDGKLRCVAWRRGEHVWTADLGAPIWTKPLLASGMAVVGTIDGRMAAVSLETGSVAWDRKVGREVYLSDPVLHGGCAVAGTVDGRLVALRMSDGRRAWSFDAGGAIRGGPALAGGVFYLHSTSGLILAVEAASRRILWSRSLRGGSIYAPEALDDRVITGTGSGLVYALDRRTGETLWKFKSPGRSGICSRMGGSVAAASWNGNVYALGAGDGRLEWTLKTLKDVRGFPLVLDGRLYVGSLDFHLYAVEFSRT